jgi:hypothetical protein
MVFLLTSDFISARAISAAFANPKLLASIDDQFNKALKVFYAFIEPFRSQ